MIVKNEEKNLSEALSLVNGWADEIIIVDDHSADRTIEIARRYTSKIYQRKMDLEGKQRNFGVDKAVNSWVMFQDADERLTPELKDEIDQFLTDHDGVSFGVWIPRKNYIGNYWLRYGGWYPSPHIKIYHRDYIRWKEDAAELVHPGLVNVKEYKVKNLKNHLIHYNFINIEDFIQKTNRQTTLEALKWRLQERKVSMAHGMWKPVDRFVKRYILKKGYKDGYYGFVAAVLSALYQFLTYSKFREIRERGAYLDRCAVQQQTATDYIPDPVSGRKTSAVSKSTTPSTFDVPPRGC